MNTEHLFDRFMAYLDSQAHAMPGAARVDEIGPRMAVAVSRQTGSGAIRVSAMLAKYLEDHRGAGEPPWTVFDKNLITQVLEDHHLSARLAKFLPEEKVNAISDTVDEILGLHPPSWIIVHQSTETILKLAQLGNVILVGRGANSITSRLPNVLHIRLVGSLERRIARIQEAEHLARPAALAFIRRTDRGRAQYVRKYFHKDVSDVLRYDLTINTDCLSEEEVVRLIADPVLSRIRTSRGRPKIS